MDLKKQQRYRIEKKEKNMLTDILNEPQKLEIEDKTYLFEFDHLALAALEKKINKSVFLIYDTLSCGGSLTIDDSLSLLTTGMLKHHSEKEIEVLKNRIKEYPGFFNIIKDSLFSAFIMPMMPPDILREFDSKKKDCLTQTQNMSVLNTTGSETT